MLFTKKKRFSIAEKQIKEEEKDQNGNTLLKINLRYPEITANKKDPLLISAEKFYKSFANELFKYAKEDLKKTALKVYNENSESFVPFSACLKYEITYLTEEFLSVLLTVSVSDGKGEASVSRKAQVWERSFGTKCKPTYFISKNEFKEALNQQGISVSKARKSMENFLLREASYEFLQEYEESIFIPYRRDDDKNLAGSVI